LCPIGSLGIAPRAMVAQKSKTVAKNAGKLFKQQKKGKRAAADEVEEEEVAAPAEAQEEEEQEPVEAGCEAEEPQISEEDALAKREKEMTDARKKELRGMYADELKELVSSKGLPLSKKDDMIEAVLAREAADRAEARAHEAKVRAAVVRKKGALEALPLPELREHCSATGIPNNLTKAARIEQLLKLWLEDDGVRKALVQDAREQRERELGAMDGAALRGLCEKAGLSPFVREVMADRIVRRERELGRFARPTPEKEEGEPEEDTPGPAKKGDLVEALLASDASRKRERELKLKQEEEAAARIKELKAMTNEELRKQLASRGQEASGKKEEMVAALFTILAQEDKVAARRAKLRSMATDDLKKLASGKGLASGKKDDIVEALIAHEAEVCEQLRGFEAKIAELLEKKREELEAKTAAELKELCASKNLKLGMGKEERVERLLEAAKTGGELDGLAAAAARDARRQELLSKDIQTLLGLCSETGADPLVKEVAIERLLAHEDEFGIVAADEEPPAKKARTQKK